MATKHSWQRRLAGGLLLLALTLLWLLLMAKPAIASPGRKGELEVCLLNLEKRDFWLSFSQAEKGLEDVGIQRLLAEWVTEC